MTQVETGLAMLRHFAPLLRVMRVEEARASFHHVRPGLGGPEFACRIRLDQRDADSWVTGELFHAFSRIANHEWHRAGYGDLSVTFDPTSGLVGIRRPEVLGSVSYTQISDWVIDDSPLFSDEVNALIRGTLPVGGAGILADWIDDRTESLSGFTAALRSGTPCEPAWPYVGYTALRFVIASANAVFWSVLGSADQFLVQGGDVFRVVGVGLVDTDGTRQEWNYRLDPPDLWRFDTLSWEAFPAPPRETP